MTKATRRSYSWIVLTVAVWLGIGASCQHCQVGQEIVIPSADTSPPTVLMDFHLPNGNTITITSASPPRTRIDVPPGGRVTVIANAKDDEGVKDVQIWAAKF